MSTIAFNNSLLCLLLLVVISSQSYAGKAPDFSLRGSSEVVRLSDYTGQVIYLDFWASWCKPCRKSFPFMNEIQRKFSKQGLKVIAINLDPEQKDAQKFLKIVPAEFTLAYDPKGITSQKYQVTTLPTSYIISREGQIIDTHTGFIESGKHRIEAQIIKALAD